MDVLVKTDFPDIRFKTLIQSATEGSVLVIPREGGYLIRIYVELDKLNKNERVAGRSITLEQLIAAAQRIFHPYKLDLKEVPWWSVYETGQRLTDRFDDVAPDDTSKQLPHIFIAGDACHTHSPKAGQGMNVSIQDGFNLGWTLAAVLQGRSPASLLGIYSAERQAVAQELTNFDCEWAAMLSGGAVVNPDAVQRYFVAHGRYTAGTATQYTPALLTGSSAHQHLATGFVVGTRFHSAPVIRIGDGKHIQLGEILSADGRWRVLAFAGSGDVADSNSSVAKLCEFLAESPASPVKRHTPSGSDPDSVIDVRAVFQQSHHHLSVTDLPELLFPPKGRYKLHDYETAFCALNNATENIYALRGINLEQGCMVVARPDQYIAQVLPLNDTLTLSEFFESFMLTASNH